MAPFKSSLARSVGKLLGVYKETDLSLRGATQNTRLVPPTFKTFTIYMMGGGATTKGGVQRGGYSESEIIIPNAALGSYNRLEVIVGQGGPNSPSPDSGTSVFGGGGAGNNSSGNTNGSPGGGGSFVFLSSPGSTNVFASNGLSLQVPVSDADGRCLIVAGGAGGNDKVDGGGGGGGGGLTAPIYPSVPGGPAGAANVSRNGGGDAYIGKRGDPGTWSSGGGGGGYEGGFGLNDFDGSGGCGYVGHINPSQSQPFSGSSPVNPNFVYTGGYTIGNTPNNGSAPWGEYTVPSAGTPYIPGPSGGQNNPGTVTIIGPSGTTTFSYTGNIQYYPFS